MINSPIQLHFLGAAGTVTGSKFLVTTAGKNILIDCGMFQGLKRLRQMNWMQFPVNPTDIDVVLLTHGHLDHTGYLPRLVNLGFRGDILGTAPTLDVAGIILKDSGKIQEEEAAKANREGYSKHAPALPLYDMDDVARTLRYFKPVPEGEWEVLGEHIQARFQYNGHIIGATFIELEIGNKHLVFSGDIGREQDLLMNPPKKPRRADYLLLESTYGDRIHPIENTQEILLSLISDTIAKNGTLLIPSFAVERSQLLIFLLWKLQQEQKIPPTPIYLDTPMGANVLDVFMRAIDWHKLTDIECREMCRSIQVVKDMRESMALAHDKTPKVILTGSGMLTGGRILTYLQTYLEKPSTTILLVGHQAEGTRGRLLLEGAQELKIYGKYYPVKARIERLQSLSAHADQQGLLSWLSELEKAPQRLFIIHGESQAADTLRVKIKDTYGWESEIPELYEIQKLS